MKKSVEVPALTFFVVFSFQELIDVDSEVVFELASYILQVGRSALMCASQSQTQKRQE